MLAMSSGLRRLLLQEVVMLPHRLWNTAASSRQPLDLLEETIHGEATKWWNICYPRRLSLASFVILVSLLVSIVILEHHTEVGVPWKMSDFLKLARSPSFSSSTACQAQTKGYKLLSVDSIPSGIMQTTSDLQPRSLWADPIVEAQQSIASRGLLAMPVGFKQRETVDNIIEKFPADDFTVMLFHYDGIVEAWNIFPWRSRVIQVAALNQTKWWFAKRFLHPDIIAPYKYIFIWDEDIGVENFHAGRYLDIVEKEGLEISQPALDPALSEVHHQITVRRPRGKAHRRMFKFRGSGLCFENSTQPPCTGWVEMMVPVFSRQAWRCAWYMIQNDLVHAWGLDMKLGYCAQGDRSKKVGVVDEEYVVHFGIPSLGGLPNKISKRAKNQPPAPSKQSKVAVFDYQDRGAVRRRSYVEHEIFQKRWKAAANEDKCWVDPYRKL